MKIAFHAGTLDFRGSHVAIFDYALHNQTLLNNESIIFYDGLKSGPPEMLKKFQKYFETIPYQSFNDINELSALRHIDALYILKPGHKDHQLISTAANLIHAVFPQKISQEHGSVYAYVSSWLSKECSNSKIPYVDHMVTLPKVNDDLRAKLAIPLEAQVFGYLGGRDSFNIKFVQDSIVNNARNNKFNYFVFMNVDPFCDLENVFFLAPNSNLEFKTQFINTCDAMIHAREIGESFGLACAEFSIRNKPIITFALSEQKNHIEILKDKAYLYRNANDLDYILTNFDRKWSVLQSWDCYSEKFSPHVVMQKFKEVFLDTATYTSPSRVAYSLKDHLIIEGKRQIRKLNRSLRKPNQ
jgi:hypothetical protein